MNFKRRAITIVISLGILLGCLVTGRATWEVQALRTKESVVNIIDTGITDKTADQAMDSISVQIAKTKTLARTCVFLLECTPKQAKSALYLVNREEDRVAATRKFLLVRAKAIAAYNAQDQATLQSLKAEYYADKADIADITKDIDFGSQEMDLPKDLRAIFAATV